MEASLAASKLARTKLMEALNVFLLICVSICCHMVSYCLYFLAHGPGAQLWALTWVSFILWGYVVSCWGIDASYGH